MTATLARFGTKGALAVDGLSGGKLLMKPSDVHLVVDGLQFGSLYHLSDMDTAAGCIYPDDYGTSFMFHEHGRRRAWTAQYSNVHALAHNLRSEPIDLEECSW